MQSIASHNNYLVFLFCPQTKKAANLCDLLLFLGRDEASDAAMFFEAQTLCLSESSNLVFYQKFRK